MATRRTRAPKVVPAYRLLTDDIPNAPGMCLWAHTTTGQHVLMTDGLDPNVSEPLPDTTPEDAPEQTAADRIAEMLLRSRDQVEARVKVNELQDDGSRAFCADYSPEEFERGGTLTLIRKKWGPGRYIVELFARNPQTKRFSCYGRDTVTIKPQQEPDQGELAGTQFERLAERIERALADKPAAVSSSEQLMQQLTLMKAMREAMGITSQPAASPVSLLGDLVKLMAGAREIAKEVNPPSEPEGLLERLAPKALDIVRESVAHQQLNPVALPPTLTGPAPAPAVPKPAAAVVPANGEAMDKEEIAGLKVAVATLNGLALFRMDPDAAADMIFDQVPDEAIPLLERSDWFEQLARVDPSCQRHKEWYIRAHAALLKLIEEEKKLPPEDDEPRAAA